jgi:hypothetical protein
MYEGKDLSPSISNCYLDLTETLATQGEKSTLFREGLITYCTQACLIGQGLIQDGDFTAAELVLRDAEGLV